MEPITGKYIIETKYYNNMETKKKKINWLKIWQIIRDALVLLLATKEGIDIT